MTRPLEQLRVAVLEHRYGVQLSRLLEKQGAIALAYPLVKETPTEDSDGIRLFIESCSTRPIDYIVFYTGVGADFLFKEASTARVVPPNAKTIARGPKAIAGLRRAGVRIDLVASSPTTEGIIQTLSGEDLNGKSVLVQLYGTPIPTLADWLAERGAVVTEVSPYRYTEASDQTMIDQLIEALTDGRVDAVTFTSATQVHYLIRAAASRGKEQEVRERFRSDVLVVSIGEVTARTLESVELRPHVIPSEPKMAPMVQALADYIEQRRRECITRSFLP